MQKYLTIHGHFYQPPRENPWTEIIERQPSAYPEHDWNEKINAECYFPNGFSRILDSSDRITEIINNYKNISFNFGPTLLSWLELHAPRTYMRIIAADRDSLQRQGHGAAIAQCYNHMIMPLATRQDQRTQIIWGIADFRYRFQREPEAIWLPETAINQTTLNILTEFPFKYIILSPHQAQRVRPLDQPQANWQNVEFGNIDTRLPFRCFARDESGQKIPDRFLDVFFYNGDLARGISFENLLVDARVLADRIEQAFGDGDNSRLVSIATDGENYGHHKRFGDMAIAYLLHVEAPKRNLQPINYGAYLAKHPPVQEVELKAGPNDEGTAWSCAHGVGRWYRDCGCHTGGELSWNQAWRTALRKALDNLREQIDGITEEIGRELFRDVWAARNDYIEVILKRSEARMLHFLEQHGRQPLDEGQRVRAIKLMELQRHRQLMYTSCGWFFSEISGIETVQVIQYAARALQLAQELSQRTLEAQFLRDLRHARSNITRYGDGEWIYNHFVKPSVVSFGKVVNQYAICSLFDLYNDHRGPRTIYVYEIEELDRHHAVSDGKQVLIGKVRVKSTVTQETSTLTYLLLNVLEAEEIRSMVREARDDFDYEAAKAEVLQGLAKSPAEIFEQAKALWRGDVFSIGDLFPEERQKIVDTIMRKELQEVVRCAEEIYEKSRTMIATISRLGLHVPDEIIQPAKFTLTNVINREVRRLANIADPQQYKKAIDAARTARRIGISLNTEEAAQIFQRVLEKRLDRLIDKFTPAEVTELEALIRVHERLRLRLHRTPIQNRLYMILKQHVEPLIERIVHGLSDRETSAAVACILRIAYRFNFNTDSYNQRLGGY